MPRDGIVNAVEQRLHGGHADVVAWWSAVIKEIRRSWATLDLLAVATRV